MNKTLENYVRSRGFPIPENWEDYRIYFNNNTYQLHFSMFSDGMNGYQTSDIAKRFHLSIERTRCIIISMAQKVSEFSRDNHYIGIKGNISKNGKK